MDSFFWFRRTFPEISCNDFKIKVTDETSPELLKMVLQVTAHVKWYNLFLTGIYCDGLYRSSVWDWQTGIYHWNKAGVKVLYSRYPVSFLWTQNRPPERISLGIWWISSLIKKLEQGSFQWPRSESEVRDLTAQQFGWLMEGLTITPKKTVYQVNPPEYIARPCAKQRNFQELFCYENTHIFLWKMPLAGILKSIIQKNTTLFL